jgi:hypothetical protein
LYRADDLLVGRVDDFERLAVYGLDPLVVDEPVALISVWPEYSASAMRRGRDKRVTYRPVGCSYSPECGVLSLMDNPDMVSLYWVSKK